jgi:hypothetical protein
VGHLVPITLIKEKGRAFMALPFLMSPHSTCTRLWLIPDWNLPPPCRPHLTQQQCIRQIVPLYTLKLLKRFASVLLWLTGYLSAGFTNASE